MDVVLFGFVWFLSPLVFGKNYLDLQLDLFQIGFRSSHGYDIKGNKSVTVVVINYHHGHRFVPREPSSYHSRQGATFALCLKKDQKNAFFAIF